MKTELSIYFENLPRTAKKCQVAMTNSRTLKEHTGTSRIYGTSLVFSDIWKEPGDLHYFEVTIFDSSDRTIDKAYLKSELPQQKNIITFCLVSGSWKLRQQINLKDSRYDVLVIAPLLEDRQNAGDGTHSFYFANSKNGSKTAAGVFCHLIDDRESSLYGVGEIIFGNDKPENMFVCNENISNPNLQIGVSIDPKLHKVIFPGKVRPYSIIRTGDRVEVGLWVSNNMPKQAVLMQSLPTGAFFRELGKRSSSLTYDHPLPNISDGKEILLTDVPVLQFRKQCVGKYKVFPYRFSSVSFLTSVYDILFQRVRAFKLI